MKVKATWSGAPGLGPSGFPLAWRLSQTPHRVPLGPCARVLWAGCGSPGVARRAKTGQPAREAEGSCNAHEPPLLPPKSNPLSARVGQEVSEFRLQDFTPLPIRSFVHSFIRHSSRTHLSISASQHLSISASQLLSFSASQHLSFSASQLFSFSASQLFSISAFQLFSFSAFISSSSSSIPESLLCTSRSPVHGPGASCEYSPACPFPSAPPSARTG